MDKAMDATIVPYHSSFYLIRCPLLTNSMSVNAQSGTGVKALRYVTSFYFSLLLAE